MAFKTQKRTLQDLAFLVPVSLFFLFFRLGHPPIESWNEGIYATVAKELAESGRWLRLTFGGEAWFNKPPLGIWATALFYQLFGVSEFTARLFSALSAFGAVLFTYFFGKKLFGRWTGLVAALVLLSSSHFLSLSRSGLLDIPLLFFTILALYFFWLGGERNRYFIFSGIAIALATLTKGLAALWVFPMVWVYCWWADELEVLGRSSYWVGVMVAVLIALPWNLYEMYFYHEAILQETARRHLVLRVFFSFENIVESAVYYSRVFVTKFHPWVLASIFVLPIYFLRTLRDRDMEGQFLCTWILFFFAVLALNPTRMEWYFVPVYPAMALVTAFFLTKIFGEKQRTVFFAIALTVLVLHVPYSHIFENRGDGYLKAIAKTVQRKVPAEAPVYLFNYREVPAARFYLERLTENVATEETLRLLLKEKAPVFCLMPVGDWRAMKDKALKNLSRIEAVSGNLLLLTFKNLN